MAFTAADVKTLREMTSVGMMDCKKALTECDGDMDKAVEWLREKGLAKAAKKAGRIAAEDDLHGYLLLLQQQFRFCVEVFIKVLPCISNNRSIIQLVIMACPRLSHKVSNLISQQIKSAISHINTSICLFTPDCNSHHSSSTT